MTRGCVSVKMAKERISAFQRRWRWGKVDAAAGYVWGIASPDHEEMGSTKRRATPRRLSGIAIFRLCKGHNGACNWGGEGGKRRQDDSYRKAKVRKLFPVCTLPGSVGKGRSSVKSVSIIPPAPAGMQGTPSKMWLISHDAIYGRTYT